ncbi:uncharacterized protein LOC103177159 [Callorhinchus milii]|uniref:uncharacterized protein LOC103177159 n=1 Tax=Callorhinchus milii TaxID=7868 RepID=UPI00045763FB|nr:uncharacterized protein LOC103177159 [Callorhinchus milii]XP_007889388.1 uncharacterized protein LOC103177159 [Callorhinchus milii]|eukprot:gi/632948064/ref/XP_007889387.1/ PREDICTED: uncharacterized protein LOC103177159 [Callorhinchus milii]
MGCCGSKDSDNDDVPDRVVVNQGVHRQAVVPRNSGVQTRQVASRSGFGPRIGEVKVKKVRSAVAAASASATVPKPGRVQAHDVAPPTAFAKIFSAFVDRELPQDELDGRGGRHWEENQFFQIFFSAMDNKAGFKGILRRWEKALQETVDSGENVKWPKIWLKKGGYITTLQRIQGLIQRGDKSLPMAKLREWATKVVNRRKQEYQKAQGRHKADSNHLKALETWKQLDRALQAQG